MLFSCESCVLNHLTDVYYNVIYTGRDRDLLFFSVKRNLHFSKKRHEPYEFHAKECERGGKISNEAGEETGRKQENKNYKNKNWIRKEIKNYLNRTFYQHSSLNLHRGYSTPYLLTLSDSRIMLLSTFKTNSYISVIGPNICKQCEICRSVC